MALRNPSVNVHFGIQQHLSTLKASSLPWSPSGGWGANARDGACPRSRSAGLGAGVLPKAVIRSESFTRHSASNPRETCTAWPAAELEPASQQGSYLGNTGGETTANRTGQKHSQFSKQHHDAPGQLGNLRLQKGWRKAGGTGLNLVGGI